MYDEVCRQLIINVIKFMEEEKNNLSPLLPLTAVVQRAARALQVSEKTIKNILAEDRGDKPQPSGNKGRRRKRPMTDDLPPSKKSQIREEIYKLHKQNAHITIVTLHQHLLDREMYHGSTSSLRRLLRNIGFHFKKHNGRKALCEKPHIIVKRAKFLREFHRLQEEGLYKFVFLDETWIFSKGGNKHIWTDDSINCCRTSNTGDGKRYIVLHAGGAAGFVDNASLIFSSKNKSHDYHDNMNGQLFKTWLQESLILALEEPTVAVLDNASYHTTVSVPIPNSSWRKANIQQWLHDKNIEYDPNAFKRELLLLVQQNKPEIEFEVDRILGEHGHLALRLPPYHCHYNPIEHIWANAKHYYDSHIGQHGFNDANVLAMWKEALENVTIDTWRNSVRHCQNIIEEDFKSMRLMDRAEQELIIFLGDDDSDDNEFDADSESENSDN